MVANASNVILTRRGRIQGTPFLQYQDFTGSFDSAQDDTSLP